MCDLKSFDVQARGVAAIAEDWKSSYDEVRAVWLLEELMARLAECLREAEGLYDDYRLGKLPDAGPFAYYVATFRTLVASGRDILDAAMSASRDGYAVTGSAELNRRLDAVQEIIDEDEFAQTSHAYED